MTYTQREIDRDQATHDHMARNARSRGHAENCDKVAGHWTTAQGVGVNWPTMLGRPACTCGLQRERTQ